MENTNYTESEVKYWLQTALSKESLGDFSVQILGNSEKGEGYIGDVVFARLTTESAKEYNLVLKCSKRSKTLREMIPVKEAFDNEMFFYDVLLPTFTQFQIEKGLTDPFNSVPKCYGTFADENVEVIVLENLKESGYNLWDKRKPLTRKHIEMVLEEYAKFHAISMVMDVEKPDTMSHFTSTLVNVFDKFVDSMDLDAIYGQSIGEIADALKDEFDEDILSRWKNLKQQIYFIFKDLMRDSKMKKVIVHGDCWNNNFLYKYASDGRLLKVVILDWQISGYISPVFDLSYYIFPTISGDDLGNLDEILTHYHNSLGDNLNKLGHDVSSLYPIEQFWEEWRKFCKFGILLSSILIKIACTDKSEVIDYAQAAESGEGLHQAYAHTIKDTELLRNRTRGIVKYAADNNFI